MPSEASIDTQCHSPRGESSRRKPSAEGDLQAEVELLRASVAKTSENYEQIRTKNVELEHDCRALKHHLEGTRHQLTQQDDTQDIGHTQLNQPLTSHHSAHIQTRPDKGKGHLHPEVAKSKFLHVPPPKDQPNAPAKVYRDYPIQINVDLHNPKVTQLGPLPKPTRTATTDEVGDSDDWEPYNPEDWETHCSEDFEGWQDYPTHLPNHIGLRHPMLFHMLTRPCASSLRRSNAWRASSIAATSPSG
ncbi:hypothetical protein ACE6H2_026513 [Prunus campanulata]